MADIVERLLCSEEPSIRYKVRVNVLGEEPTSLAIRTLQGEIRTSPRVRALFSEQDESGRIPHHPYAKWRGSHWTLAALAHLDHPAGDTSLAPLRDQVYDWLLGPRHVRGVKAIQGRFRRCASQEGNALWATLALGIADERATELARNLMRWQWPDGGWNCDKKPEAVNSSFHETLIPCRALARYGRERNDGEALAAAQRAAEVFLKRRLFRRQRDGSIIEESFVALHYPAYWHYGILSGLTVMAELGLIGDERCREALDLLESKRLDDGGFPAEGKYYHMDMRRGKRGELSSGFSPVDWGGANRRRTNEWVTVEALAVLVAAGRLRT